MLAAQFSDGFGGRFHGVLLGVYILRVGGLASFAGFAAIGTLGGVLAPVVASTVTGRFGGQVLMRGAAVMLMAARIGSYAAVLLLDAVWVLFALRLLGAVCGMLLVNGAKGQVSRTRDVSTSLAWLNVANGGGQVVASVTAGLLATTSDSLIAVVATPTVMLATVPMLRLARFAPTVQVRVREQFRSLPDVARPALLGSVVMALIAAPLLLADGLTAEQYGVAWLGPLSAMTFLGGFGAASTIPLLNRVRLSTRHDPLLWAGLGAMGLSVWAFSDIGPLWLLVGRVLAGLATGLVGSRIEARVVEAVPEDRTVPALAASAGAGSLAAAIAAWLVAPSVSLMGIRGFTLLCMLLLAGVGIGTTAVTAVRERTAAGRAALQAA